MLVKTLITQNKHKNKHVTLQQM